MKKTTALRLVTGLTQSRILLTVLLYPLAFSGERIGFLIAFFVAALTDLVDGTLARGYNVTSEYGARLDTFADQLLLVSSGALTLVFEPLLFERFTWYLIPVGIIILNNIICKYKHGRAANFHLYTAKLGTASLLFTYLWIIAFGYNALVYWTSYILITIAAIETGLVVLFVKKPKTNMGSYWK